MKTVADLNKLREKIQNDLKARAAASPQIIIGLGTCGLAAGGKAVLTAIEAELAKHKLDIKVKSTSCIGMCEKEVLVDIILPGQPRITYANVTPDTVPTLISEHIVNGRIVADMVVGKIEAGNIG